MAPTRRSADKAARRQPAMCVHTRPARAAIVAPVFPSIPERREELVLFRGPMDFRHLGPIWDRLTVAGNAGPVGVDHHGIAEDHRETPHTIFMSDESRGLDEGMVDACVWVGWLPQAPPIPKYRSTPSSNRPHHRETRHRSRMAPGGGFPTVLAISLAAKRDGLDGPTLALIQPTLPYFTRTRNLCCVNRCLENHREGYGFGYSRGLLERSHQLLPRNTKKIVWVLGQQPSGNS